MTFIQGNRVMYMLKAGILKVNNKKEKYKIYLQLSCIFNVICIKCSFDLEAIFDNQQF